MKKNLILVFLLAILIHNSASALWYNRLSDSTVCVIYNASYDTNTNWHVTIPDTVYMKFSTDNVYRTYKVIGIADNAFKNCTNIYSVSIGSNVLTIGNSAFSGCEGLDGTFSIPNSVVTIGQSAFWQCSGVDTLIIGENVTTIGQNAFDGCTGVRKLYYNAINCTTPLGNYGSLKTNVQTLVVGNSVTNLPNNAFSYFSGLESVIIGQQVVTIGNYAFCYCTNIQHLEIGGNVTTIGTYAFSNCSSISGLLEIPDKVTTIGRDAFSGCGSIDSIYIGKKVTSIGELAFGGCTNIKYMYYNAQNCTTWLSYHHYDNTYNVHHYGPFYGAIQSNLQKLIIGNDVQTIPYGAFYGCSHLNGELNIPNSVTTVGASAFYNCSSLDSLILGQNITFIGENAFQGCANIVKMYYNSKNCTISNSFSLMSSLQLLIIGNGVQSIPSNAFRECTLLNEVVIPNSVTSIGSYAFSNCSGLDGNLLITNSVASVGEKAFYNCSDLDTLIIGGNVATIGSSAFAGCVGIRKIYYYAKNCMTPLTQESSSPFWTLKSNTQTLIIGDSVQTIPSYAFNGFSNLNGALSIPKMVTSIGAKAFYNCSGIDTLIVGENVSIIGDYAFQGCGSIQKMYYNAKNCNTQLCYNSLSPFYGSIQSGLQSLIIGEGVSSIPAYAFKGCSQIIGRLDIPNTVKQIGSYAFADCSGFNGGLIFPDSLTIINPYSFYGCSGIDSIMLNSHLSAIYSNAFNNCTELSNIRFSNNLHSIEKKAFYNCNNLLSLDFDSLQITFGDSVFADCDRLVTVTLGSNISNISDGMFAGCFRLTTINFGGGIISIGDNAFRDCIRLVTPHFSSSLTTIGENAFRNCPLVMGQLLFPENVTSIGPSAFSGCSGVSSLLMKPIVPPTIYATTFDSINVNIPVYVTCGYALNYYVTDYWENFPNIVEMEPYQVNLSVNNEAMGNVSITSPPTCGNPQAIIAATSNEGFHFTHWSDGNTNNPRVLSLNQDTSLVANFTVNQAYITVHSNDSVKGHVSGSGLYIYNAPVVLMATANEGYHFIHWNDGNTQNPRYVTAIQDSVFTAIFVSNLSNINVLNNNPEMGTVSGSGVYYYQNYATLSATSNYGYHFTHWNDGNTDNPRMLFVDRDTTFIASFALNVYAISASSENTTMGSVSGGGNYTYNMQISLTANANFGYHFSQWSDGNTQNPRNVVVTKDSVFTAQFAANTYTLSVSSDDPDMGSAYGAGTFTYNSQTTISAAANYGYHFTQWSDGNTENPRIVTINGNREYIAMFAINFYTITVNSSNPALGSASGGGTYNYNSNISISATPNYGYHFTQWSDGNTQNPRNITVMQNATYTAQFAVNTYSVTVNSNNASMGTVLGGGNYIYQTPATISAMPNYGYHFVQWNDGNTDNPRTIVITQNEVFSAQFDYNTYTLTALSNNYLAGTVTGGGSYNYTSVVSVLAVPNEHYHFVQWSDLLTDNPRNITMTQDTLITAQFEIDQHTINVQSANATMGSTSGGGSFSYGTSIPISATANYGYHFVSWSDESTQNPRTVMVSGDASYIAMFEANLYVVNSQSSDDEMGIVTGAGTYPYLATVTLQAIPQTGHHFTQWSDGNTENPRIITLTNDTVLNAQFAINMYSVNILVNDSTMGSVSGSGVYPYLSQVTVSATAAEHHHFVQWGDGSTSNPRQFTVTSDLSLEAIFAEDAKFLISAYTPDTLMGQVYGAGEYYAGTQISLTAVPNAHYQFVQWTDGVTDNPRSIVVLENATFMAVFSPLSYDILAYSSNEMWGTVYGTGTYDYHTTVTLEAVANPGYHFVCWNDGDSNAVRTILVEGNAVYIASFAEGVGVEEHQLRRDISIYPNPTTDMLYIDANDVRTIEIFNIYGQLLAQFEGDNKVDMSGFDAGTYIVRITHLDGILEKKVIKI